MNIHMESLISMGKLLVLGRIYIGIVNGLVTCTTNLQDSY